MELWRKTSAERWCMSYRALLLSLRKAASRSGKSKRLFFSEEKKQKTFVYGDETSCPSLGRVTRPKEGHEV
jgi:hypothetical protein